MTVLQQATPKISHPCDLRAWLDDVEKLGQLERIAGAHCDLEIGALNPAQVQIF